jgi:hypothetical protein
MKLLTWLSDDKLAVHKSVSSDSGMVVNLSQGLESRTTQVIPQDHIQYTVIYTRLKS